MTAAAGEPVLSTWTIYENPADAPGMFVVRRWDVVRGQSDPVPTREATTHRDLYSARQSLPQGLYRIDREFGDDPTIVESWL